MKTANQIARQRRRPMTTYVIAILVATLVQVADAQEPSKPFVLKPASPIELGPIPAAASYPTVTEENLVPQPVPPGQQPGGTVTHGTIVPGSIVPGTILPGNPRRGETIYIGPDGRLVRPTYVYRGGRVYRVAPTPNNASIHNNYQQPRPPRPSIDYSMAPVQPAIRPRLAPQQVPQIVAKARVVDGAPLVRQETVVSADQPAEKKKPMPPRKPVPAPNNTRWLAGVRRMMDGNRSSSTRSGSTCPKCGKRQESARVASKSSSADWN